MALSSSHLEQCRRDDRTDSLDGILTGLATGIPGEGPLTSGGLQFVTILPGLGLASHRQTIGFRQAVLFE